jgi:hypothetical protein
MPSRAAPCRLGWCTIMPKIHGTCRHIYKLYSQFWTYTDARIYMAAPVSFFYLYIMNTFTCIHGTYRPMQSLLASSIEYILASLPASLMCIYACMALQHIGFFPSHYMKKPASFFAFMYVTMHMYLHMYFPLFFNVLGNTHRQGCTYGFYSDKNPSNK